jgi:serine-type D-Ala-D-Ala carboxypeptidase/endopeptidase
VRTMLVACLLSLPASAKDAPTDVERWIEARVADGSVGAAAFAEIVAADIRTRGFGKRADGEVPGADTQFQAGSVTKVFTNLLLAEMAEDEAMAAATGTRYETTLGDVFGEALAPRNPAVARITLEQLATHTSGLPRLPANLDASDAIDPYGRYDAEDLLAGLAGTRDEQPLGRFYAYSNFGAAVLGEALGRLDGRGYRTALRERVIRPANLRRTTFAPDADSARATAGGEAVDPWRFDAFAPAGGLWSSAGDLAYLVSIYFGRKNSWLHDKNSASDRVVDAGSFGVSHTWHLAAAGDATILWHNGATHGFHAMVAFRRDEQRGLVVLVAGEADPTEVVLRALGNVPARPRAAQVDAAVLGQYQLVPSFGIGVFERDGQLFGQATGQPAIALHAVGGDWYALGEVDASLHFVREAGKVVALELAQNGAVQRAKRVADAAAVASREEIELPEAVLAGYAGEYALAPGIVLAVRPRTGGIEAMLTGQPWFPVHASAKDRFFYRVVDAELAFERDAAGNVSAVTLHQGAVVQRAPRTQ